MPLPRGSTVTWLAVGSALLNFFTFIVVAAAYESADFSLVYPIARGGAPALIALGAVLVLGERLGWVGACGIALVVGGLVFVSGTGQPTPTRPMPHLRRGILLAAVGALLVATYSIIDAAAVRRTPAIPYVLEVFVIDAALLVPLVAALRGPRVLIGAFRTTWKTMASVSALWFAAYGLALRVYAFSPVAYAGAVREVSIVFGALAGWLWLDEGFGLRRTLGALLALGGIILLALAGV
jgi:drug/metabolite transporter (DMT)-like permease